MNDFCSAQTISVGILFISAVNNGFILNYPSVVNSELIEKLNISKHAGFIFEGLTYLTAIAGPYISDLLFHILSRKITMLVLIVISTILWFVLPSINENTFWGGYIIRSIMGFIAGASSSLIPIYMVELAPSTASGFFGSFYPMGVFSGILLCEFIGSYLDWKNLSYIAGGICLLYLFMHYFISDSPVSHSNQSIHETIFHQKYMSALIFGIALFFVQNFVGYFYMIKSIPNVFVDAGIIPTNSIARIITEAVITFSAIIGSFFLQFLGRKISWITSSAGILISYIIKGICYKVSTPSWVPLFALLLFFFSYSLGVGLFPFFSMAELMPTPVRSISVAIVSSVSWLFYLLNFGGNELLIRVVGNFSLTMVFLGFSFFSLIFGMFFVNTPDFQTIAADLYQNINDSSSG